MNLADTRKNWSIPLLAGLLALSGAWSWAQSGAAVTRVRDDIRYLASDQLEGRFTGSAGADSASAYIRRRWTPLGLQPGVPGWFQVFSIEPDAPLLRDIPEGHRPRDGRGRNVVGILRGRDPGLREEAVVVGAHYDHLGRGEIGALDPENRGEVHNGADDNASGVAALLEIARHLAGRPPRRSVVFVAFAGEELGLLGSAAYVKQSAVAMERTVAMVNLDMVGRLRSERLLVFGAETAVELPGLLDSLNRRARFDLRASGDGYGRSDHQSFYLARRPVLHLFTDLHPDYHRASDHWEKVDAAGLVRVANFAADVVRALADRPEPLTFVERPAPVPVAASATPSGSGYGAYLGSIPDMSASGPGVRLSGVRPGSPAEQAGLRADDVLLRIGTEEIADLQAMADALRSHQPGDTVAVVFRRGAATDTVRVVLGRRGG